MQRVAENMVDWSTGYGGEFAWLRPLLQSLKDGEQGVICLTIPRKEEAQRTRKNARSRARQMDVKVRTAIAKAPNKEGYYNLYIGRRE